MSYLYCQIQFSFQFMFLYVFYSYLMTQLYKSHVGKCPMPDDGPKFNFTAKMFYFKDQRRS